MTLYPNICFIGQGPSKGAWYKHLKLSGPMWAEKECARLALLGRIGERLACMIGMSPLEFAIAFRRENLNKKFVGKKGRGDNFDWTAGCMCAAKLIEDKTITKYVLLGSNVARCFLVKYNWLDVFERGDKSFLFLPHPSGLNIWYNSKANKIAAAKSLTSFVYGRN